MDVVILGAGSHGSDLGDIAAAAGHRIVAVLDDHHDGFPPCRTLSEHPAEVGYLIGVNHPADRQALDRPDRTAATAIHPAAHIAADLDAAEGTVIAAGAVIGHHVRLGRHVHINQAATLIRTSIGDYTTIAPGVDIAGDVTIGAGVFIGIGARISNLVTIGDGATIGAGAVVLNDIPAGECHIGIPARPLTGATP